MTRRSTRSCAPWGCTPPTRAATATACSGTSPRSRSALSDQLYGDPQHHAELRALTCAQLEAHPELYAGFVETGRPFDAYVAEMKKLGTYGGHLELSAFAHAVLKQIRIVQPGYVYVVACDDDSRAAHAARERREVQRRRAIDAAPAHHDAPRAAHTRRGTRAAAAPRRESIGPLHIAYHSWEHYSSLRRLDGPHTGLPCIPLERGDTREDADDADAESLRWIELSAPGHPPHRVRQLLRELGAWEDVVEALLEDPDADDGASGDADEHTQAHAATPEARSSDDGTPCAAPSPRAARAARRSHRRAKAEAAQARSSNSPDLCELTI